MIPAPHDTGLSRKHLIAACEASLRRLQTDYLDLYLCHQPDMSCRSRKRCAPTRTW